MHKRNKNTSSLPDARKLTKRLATSMAKVVDDLTKLRKLSEEIKNKLDNTSDTEMADSMYIFYNRVAHLEQEIEEAHYDFKQMYEELGGTDTIPDPETIW